mgnify:CR=1 FL=1
MAASEEMRFEDAMEYRDLIRSIQKIGERQKITGYGEEDKDIIAVAMDESLDLREQDAVVQVFFVRGGKLIGREHFLSACGAWRYKGSGIIQLYEAILCRNSVYPT